LIDVITINNKIQQVYNHLIQFQYLLTSEKQLQNAIENSFKKNNVSYEREKNLTPFGKVDFFINGIAIEVKIKGQKKSIYRQCRDYCQHPEVEGLMLLTSVAMALPETIDNKPIIVFSLGRNHL